MHDETNIFAARISLTRAHEPAREAERWEARGYLIDERIGEYIRRSLVCPDEFSTLTQKKSPTDLVAPVSVGASTISNGKLFTHRYPRK